MDGPEPGEVLLRLLSHEARLVLLGGIGHGAGSFPTPMF